ncbi:MAG: trehalose-phosphatase [Dehalococcoidales bacterium]|nr:trehalose-phosphatase [Dehalococcoidales bacterium]
MPYAFERLALIEGVIARSPLGLITDVDGTISEIVPTPREARVSPLCRRYLTLLCRQLALVAVVSGRPAVEVRDMVGVTGVVYVGNHGLERWTKNRVEPSGSARDYFKIVRSAFEELSSRLSMEGVTLEDKGLSLTVHYRLSPHHEVAEREILDVLAASERARDLRVVRGRLALNLLPPVEINKGTAVLDLIRDYSLQGGLYLGDDLTDIDAFGAVRSAAAGSNFRGLAIGVTSAEMPEGLVKAADLTLNGVDDVGRFLKWLSQNVPQPS